MRLGTAFARGGTAAVAVMLLAGCFTSGTDFQTDAEDYLLESEELRSGIFPDADTTITDATCAEPGSSDVGTTFLCSAHDSTGGEWEFEVEITSRTGYRVNVSRYPSPD